MTTTATRTPITAVKTEKVITVKDCIEDEKTSLPSAIYERNRVKYSRERIEFLAEQYNTSTLLMQASDPKKLLTTVTPSMLFARIVTLVHLSPHAAVHMIDTKMDIAKKSIYQETVDAFRDAWDSKVKKGETLGHLAARQHVEYAISILQGRHLMGEQNDYKREILRLQNADGVTVREVCIAKVSSFLRRTRKEEEEHILY